MNTTQDAEDRQEALLLAVEERRSHFPNGAGTWRPPRFHEPAIAAALAAIAAELRVIRERMPDA